MSKRHVRKHFVSIRSKLFLQVGCIFLLVVLSLLAINRWYLPEIYAYNTRQNMRQVAEEINALDASAQGFAAQISEYEKENALSIDVYAADGTQLYIGKNPFFSAGGKVTVLDRREYQDGSYFETQDIERQKMQYIVFICARSDGGSVEMYSRRSTIDDNTNSAIWLMTVTSIAALGVALLAVFLYVRRFTKPLIEMRNVTKNLSELDFSKRCSADSQDEIGELSGSINSLSDALQETLAGLQEKNRRLQDDIAREQKLDKMRKDFISNVSHELKTPIAIVQGYAEGAKLLAETENGKKAGEYCDIIVSEAKRMNELVLQLLELSQYESGGVSANREVFDFEPILTEYVRAARLQFEEAGVHCTYQVPSPCLCFADSVKICMVLNNYVSNACVHAAGKKELRITVEKTEDTRYTVRVFNTGEPIAEADMLHIWDSFYRADKSHSRSEGRFGLGLSIVSEIQKLHGMAYGVENQADGVLFWFDIAAAPTDALQEPPADM